MIAASRLATTIATLAELARGLEPLDRRAALLDLVREQLEALFAWCHLELSRGGLDLGEVAELGEVLERLALVHGALWRDAERQLRRRGLEGARPA